MFVLIFIALWACALVIWWICSNAFRHSDLDKLKSRLIGTSKPKTVKAAVTGGSLIQTDEKNVLLATKFLRRFQLQSKLQELLEQAGMKWSTHRLVNTCLVAVVAAWALAWILLPDQFQRFSYVPALGAGALPVLCCENAKRGCGGSRSCFRTVWNSCRAPCAPGMPSRCRSK
jgi:Flp pilus assembly protein TadB